MNNDKIQAMHLRNSKMEMIHDKWQVVEWNNMNRQQYWRWRSNKDRGNIENKYCIDWTETGEWWMNQVNEINNSNSKENERMK